MKKPTKKHIKLYDEFLKRINKPETLFHPRVRGSKRKLIPAPGKYPCDVCALAQYNRLCLEFMRCAPYLYYQMGIVEKLTNGKNRSMP